MRTISFRYNKYSPRVLYIMVIFAVSLGFLVYYAFLMYSGIGRGPEFAPSYFRENPRHAVYLIFGLIPIALLVPALLAIKCWSSEEEEGQISLSEEYAVLYLKNKEFRIEKGGLHLRHPTARANWYFIYILKFAGRKIVLVSSAKEVKEMGSALSLDLAMEQLSFYEAGKKRRRNENQTVSFCGMKIVLARSTPGIFDDSPYFVDYESMVKIPDATFVTCMIRERQNPVHVVGDMELDARGLSRVIAEERVLKQQVILSIIELDEEIEN